MRVAEVMTEPVVSVGMEDLLSDVIPLTTRQKVSGVPVIDSAGELVGIVSEGDLLRRIEHGTSRRRGFWARSFTPESSSEIFRHANGRRVRDVMTERAVTIEASDTLADAARLMETYGIKRLPVMREGRLVGMLTRADFLKALGRFLAPHNESPPASATFASNDSSPEPTR